MSKRRKRFLLLALLAVCICVFLFFARVGGNIWRAVYPRTYRTYVEYYADKYGLEYAQVYAIIKTESGFKPNALSAVGARGLMQITEETFDWIKTKIAPSEPVTFDDLYNPEVNIRFGTYYLHLLYGTVCRRPCHGQRGLPQRPGPCGPPAGGCALFR